ncbi:sarcoplasmic calcium-binding protein-like [Saccostrea echinata]|uniref:sarcoplasmic calcium-binding protein-like n=1 Tax=Saccostrea echinata TaxID=191078 RepID=UPI002A83D520|nr:sarcoplasmic calcium-binding protein-like [Saccostrea echinata]XP_061184509.1 sarcoplasmic calcium-binding protein-like [Saccostrea echinata]
MDYLKSKWAIWFKSLDANHDNKLSIEDMEISAKKFIEIQKILGDKANNNAGFDNTKWWNTYIFRKGPGVSLTLEEFQASLGESYQKDKAAFYQEMERCFSDIASFVAENKDRPIVEQEFAFGFKVFGQEDSVQVAKAYQLFKATKGQPNVQHIVDAWAQFIADDDASKQDMIHEALLS